MSDYVEEMLNDYDFLEECRKLDLEELEEMNINGELNDYDEDEVIENLR